MSSCCGSQPKCVVYACSGGSNVGQLSSEAAKVLDENKDAAMGCLAGLGGHVSGMVASAESGVPQLVIDGCLAACGKKIVDHLGLKNYAYVEITSLGIKKEHNLFKTPENEVKDVVEACRKEISKVSKNKD